MLERRAAKRKYSTSKVRIRAVSRYPTPKIRRRGCDEIPHAQGKRNPSKMVGVERGHQRADTLKP